MDAVRDGGSIAKLIPAADKRMQFSYIQLMPVASSLYIGLHLFRACPFPSAGKHSAAPASVFLHAEDFQAGPAQIGIAFSEEPVFKSFCELVLRNTCGISMPVREENTRRKQAIGDREGIDQ